MYASVDIKPKKRSAPPKPVKEDDRVEYAAIAYQPKDAAKNSQAAAATAPKTKRYPNAGVCEVWIAGSFIHKHSNHPFLYHK